MDFIQTCTQCPPGRCVLRVSPRVISRLFLVHSCGYYRVIMCISMCIYIYTSQIIICLKKLYIIKHTSQKCNNPYKLPISPVCLPLHNLCLNSILLSTTITVYDFILKFRKRPCHHPKFLPEKYNCQMKNIIKLQRF